MGVIVSLPIQMAGTWAASCFGSLCFSLVSKSFTSIGSSFSTRLSYAFLLLLNSILSWIMLSDFAISKLQWLMSTYNQCEGVECGFFAIHRLNFALGIFHLILSALLINVHSTVNPRAKIQNNFWAAKILLLIILAICSFLIGESFYVFWSTYISVFSGAIFLFIGLILLVDFAHEWAETCLERVEREDEHSDMWKYILASGTGLMYLGSIIMTILVYVFFASSGCSMNQAAATVNLLLIFISTGLSLHPTIQEYNPNSGLAQSAMVAVYCTYLTLSACASEPDDKQCNPLVRSNGARSASIVLGAIFTFVAIAYTTTRAAANSAFNSNSGKISINYDEPLSTNVITEEPSRNEMRLQAIREAVAVGALPESALHDQGWLYDEDEDEDEERVSTKYNYSLFHIIFFLATQWIAILLTMNVEQSEIGFTPVGRTYFYSWVKIISAWICYSIYLWSLLAPVLMPERFGH
ncbi:hypothetical protein WICMUC_005758 [Wickerhamomyces mucosus]|uniref:Membrane protein TMS1 n=1 Tax=Wickerhamomyces mucosus TaxID=1378264 RepID=A0A9P8P221_9ASCO|nr:hypothetical protein WICMUC_005758 [Wickerhamomyces mucosus]